MTRSVDQATTPPVLISLNEAAARLGKSHRQVRYMIRKQALVARKVSGRWLVQIDDVPRTPGQEEAATRKHEALRAAAEEVLSARPGPARERYSVRQLKAFQIAMPAYETAATTLGADHAAAAALRRVLEHLARGCHRFERSDKAEAYRSARDQASGALCDLLLVHTDASDKLAHTLEQDLLPAIAGLLRRTERRAGR